MGSFPGTYNDPKMILVSTSDSTADCTVDSIDGSTVEICLITPS